MRGEVRAGGHTTRGEVRAGGHAMRGEVRAKRRGVVVRWRGRYPKVKPAFLRRACPARRSEHSRGQP